MIRVELVPTEFVLVVKGLIFLDRCAISFRAAQQVFFCICVFFLFLISSVGCKKIGCWRCNNEDVTVEDGSCFDVIKMSRMGQ